MSSETRRPDVLRVASYNVHDLKDDPAAAARVIRAIAPDALCLQEVPRHVLSGHRVGDFARRCGMFFAGGHQGSGGTTVFTSLRVDVTSSGHHGLRVSRFARQRGYAVVRVALPGRPAVEVVSVHLSLDAPQRQQHARAVLDALTPGSAVVLGGDLNEVESGAAWQLIASRLRAVTPATGTFPIWSPDKRIDAVFASDGFTALSHEEGHPVDLSPEDLSAASDHLPVWVDLAVDLAAVPVDEPVADGPTT